jgi:PAS domain S-box-containing protein
MEIMQKQRSRLPVSAVQLLLGIAGLALTTFVCFRLGLGVARTGFIFVILVALVSLLGSLSASVVLSVTAAACLNYFFTEPLFDFRIDLPEDIERIAAFLATSLVVSVLTTRVRTSEARFRSVVDHATDGFFLFDEHQAILDVNKQACESLGYSREEMLGMHPRDFDASLDQASIGRIGERVNAGETVTFETLHRRKDGTVFPVEVRARQFRDGAHRFRLSLARDIGERKRAEQRLVVEHAVAQILADAASVEEAAPKILRTICEYLGWDLGTLWRIDDQSGVLRCALLWRKQLVEAAQFEAATRASTFAPGQGLPGQVWASGVAACISDVTQDRTFLRASVAVREGLHAAFAFPILSGGEVVGVIDLVSREVRHAESNLLEMMTALGSQIGQFIERKRVEVALRASEERFRTLVQFSFDVYWESDAQHRFIRQEFSEGLPDAPVAGSEIGKTRWEVPYLEPDAESWRKHRETLDAHLPFRDFELARPAPDGGKRYVSVSGLPVFDKSEKFLGYRGVGRHITERKKAEEALRRSEAYLAEAQRLSHTGTIVFSAAGPVYWSEESYEIWNLDPKQGLPALETVLQRIHTDDREASENNAFEALRQNKKYEGEFRIVLPDGTIKYLESSGHPLVSMDGTLEMIVTHIDVTERKLAQAEHERLRQLESELAHMNRLSIMGELTASLAHEILHPIATARNNARSALRFLDMNPVDLGEVREALECVVRDADRGKDIVSRIREHIKKTPPRKDRFDINQAISEVIEMVQSAIDKNNVSVSTRLMQGLLPVEGDRVQLQQVVLNLVMNAVEAMSSVEGVRKLLINTEQNKAGILVAVRDSGPGIDPKQFDRVFEPFYTTKTSGVGMGLSICRSIIGAHGGRLWVDANQGGTVFQFTLPAAEEDS